MKIYREAIKLKEKEFVKEEKHKEIKATSKQLNQRSNQHVKFSKHLSAYMQGIHTSNTHTLNKSNQILYFKNKLRQFSEHLSTHVFLVMAKSIVHAHVSRVAKNLHVVCEP